MTPSWSQHALSGHWVVNAPHRAARPKPAAAGCPFCKGNEAMTPPTLEDAPPGGGWMARAFQNSHPIVGAHEVIVDSPRHVERFDQLTDKEAGHAVRLWARRMQANRKGGKTPMVYHNDGVGAGASIPHVHAQLVAEFDLFPRVRHELETFAKGCPLEHPRFGRDHTAPGGWRIVTPDPARFAGEVWVFPKRHEPRFETLDESSLDGFAGILLAETRRIASTSTKSYNIVLHTGPAGKEFHWHAEILPRSEGIAGFELGAGVFVNTAPTNP